MNRSRAMLILAVAAASGCGGPRLPKEMTFEGTRLVKAADWSRGSASGVVFIPPGEKMESASLQLGVIANSEHKTAAALHGWVMDQYRHSPTAQWFESTTSDEACKVGLPGGTPPRPFLAIHICRAGSRGAACAEADERLPDSMLARCLNSAGGCWDEMCTQRWKARRDALEAVLRGVVDNR